MGNLLTVIVSAITEEIINKIKSNGYHTYNIDYENSFTIDGIRRAEILLKTEIIILMLAKLFFYYAGWFIFISIICFIAANLFLLTVLKILLQCVALFFLLACLFFLTVCVLILMVKLYLKERYQYNHVESNPKCKTILKKTSICAEELFKIDNVSMDDNNRLIVNLNIPKTVINIGKAAFSCTDPEFSCAGKGWIQILDSYFTLTLSMNMLNGFKLEEATIKPKLSEIKSDIKLLVNKKDCSGLANSVLRSENPIMLNFILDFVFKSQEESIKEFINNFLQEMQRSQTAELF